LRKSNIKEAGSGVFCIEGYKKGWITVGLKT
jgi:hypothetical protein